MPKKLTKEEFINREPDLLSGEYEFIGKYKGANTKTLLKHNVCNYTWGIMPNGFHQGSRCPQCSVLKRSKKRSFTKEEFIEREGDIKSGEYEMLGDYVGSLSKTLFKHNSCGYEWMITPASFYTGVRCPKCGGKESARKRSLTKHMFCSRERDIQSGEYLMLGEYMNTNAKTLFKHDACGYEWEITPGSFHAGHRCPKCSMNAKLTKEEFCDREEDIISGEYTILGDYITARKKTLFRHNFCGYKWMVTPDKFYRGRRCPRCNESKGEKSIEALLHLSNLSFEPQKRFDTCRYKKTLPFDFYINDSFLVEYDGEQHFMPNDYFGGDEGFKLRQLRDNIKTKWAKDNGIPLVRIPYTEFDNIEQIIKDSVERYCG